MGWLLCRIGRHAWQRRHSAGVGGPDADFEVCRRCGRERDRYDPITGSAIGG